MQIRRKVLCAITAFSLLGLNAKAQKVEFTEYDLPNGLHVILHDDHHAPVVAVSVMYHVGSKNEVAGRTGFAHFITFFVGCEGEHGGISRVALLHAFGIIYINNFTGGVSGLLIFYTDQISTPIIFT